MSRQPNYFDEERVVGAQARDLKALRGDSQATADRLNNDIKRAEALFARLGASVPTHRPTSPTQPTQITAPPTFEHLAATAPQGTGLQDALDEGEIEAVLTRLHAAGRKADSEAALDRWDWTIAAVAGLLAGAADLVLVGLPQNPITRLGADGGPLSNSVRAAFKRVLPPDTVASLEKAYPVPYDRADNSKLGQVVAGLGGMSHRFQALGHDPLLGWLFGVRDVLAGTFTAIGRDGVLIVQKVAEGSAGQHVFSGLLDAFGRVGGHMLSDVSTPMGLPAPLLPLAQFLQFGSFGPEGYTIAEVVRRMYLQGYDFRHFVAGGLTTAIVEVIVRGSWVARRLSEGSSLKAALPDAGIARLRRQLLLAHATAAAVNAGKIAVLQNPLALNWAQWLSLLRYLGLELAHSLRTSAVRAAAEDKLLDIDLKALSLGAQHLGTVPVPFWPANDTCVADSGPCSS